MQIYSYVITHDAGFAPNPFGGFLTLATCKPQIRKCAQIGDFIIGTGSSRTVGNHRLVYAAQVTDVISLEDYGGSPKFGVKRPSMRREWWRKHGDNIYVKVGGEWIQRRNVHHAAPNMDHDLSGANVLICRQFWYFGGAALEIPTELHEIIKRGPGHKRINDEFIVQRVVDWLGTLPRGRHGVPEMNIPPSNCRPVRWRDGLNRIAME